MNARPLLRRPTVLACLLLLASSLALPGAVAAQTDSSEGTFSLGSDVTIHSGEVRHGAVLVLMGDLTIERDARVEGDVFVGMGNADVAGDVAGDVAVGGGGELRIAGKVDGDVWSSRSVTLDDTAVVTGDVRAERELSRAAGAVVLGRVASGGGGRTGAVLSSESQQADRGASMALAVVVALLALLLPALFAALLTRAAPRSVDNLRGALARAPGRTFLLGALALVLMPVISLVLLPVAPIVWLAYLVLLVMGGVGLAAAVVYRGGAGATTARGAAFGALVLALPLAVALALAPLLRALEIGGSAQVFLLSLAVGALLSAWAIGSALLTVFGSRPWPRRPRFAVDVPAPAVPAPTARTLPPDVVGVPFETRLPVTGPMIGSVTEAMPAVAPELVDLPTVHLPEASVSPDGSTAGASPALDGEAVADEDAVASAAPMSTDVGPTVVAAPVVDVAMAEPPAVDPSQVVPPADEAVVESGPTPGWGWSEPEQRAELDLSIGPAPEPPALSDVVGLTPIFAYLLRSAGIASAADLASADPAQLVAVVAGAGVPVNPEVAAGWVQAARALLAP